MQLPKEKVYNNCYKENHYTILSVFIQMLLYTFYHILFQNIQVYDEKQFQQKYM